MPSTPFTDIISELLHIVSSSDTREQKAKQIADIIRRRGNHRWVGLYDVHATEIAVIAWSGPSAPTFPRFPVDRGLSGAAVRIGQTIIANDVSNDERYLATLANTGAEMIVPVSKGSRVAGTIDIESDSVGRFSASDRELVERCADAISALWD